MAYTTDILNSIRDAELALGDATGLEDAMSYEALEEFLKDPRRKPESLEEILDAWREDDEQEMFEQITRAQNIARLKRQLDADAGPLTDEVERDNVERDNVERVEVGDSDMAYPYTPPVSSGGQRDAAAGPTPKWAQRNVAAQIVQEEADREAQLAQSYLLGASDSDLRNEPFGALTDLDRAKQIIGDLYPAEAAPRDKWSTALEFFLKMAAASGTPGPSGKYPTALGAAGQAGSDVMDLERERVKAERAEQIDKGTATATLLAALGKTKPMTHYIDTETLETNWYTDAEFAALHAAGKTDNLQVFKTSIPNIKTPQNVAAAIYVKTIEEARSQIRQLGMTPDNEFFEQTAQELVNPDQAGNRVVRDDAYVNLTPYIIDGKVHSIWFSPDEGRVPLFVEFKQKRLQSLAKTVSTEAAMIPKIDNAMQILLENPNLTGRGKEAVSVIKSYMDTAFGTETPDVVNVDLLRAIANYVGPKMRPVGSGSTSDKEFEAYKQAILSMDNKALANYISLYTFKKMAQNSAALRQKETALLTDDRVRNADQLYKKLSEVDQGLFYKYDGENDETAFKAWLADVPEGAVILQNRRKPHVKSKDDKFILYYVKGWTGGYGANEDG